MPSINNLIDLLRYHIQNLYAAEILQAKELPAIIEKAKNGSLKKALDHHYKITQEQKPRLEQIPNLLKQHLADDTSIPPLSEDFICKGVLGLIDEANEILGNDLNEDVTDAAIIASVQKIEHYEISLYGTAHAYAHELKLTKVEALLKEALDEEHDTDDLLSGLAIASLNRKAEADLPPLENLKEPTPITPTYTQPIDRSADEGNEITERSIEFPGGRSGVSHRGYSSGESRGH